MKITLIVLLFYLTLCGILDLMNKQIPGIIIWSGLLIGTIYFIMQLIIKEREIIDFVTAIIPGIILLVISKLTDNALGTGDGIVIIITGLVLTFIQNVCMLTISFFLAAFFSIFLLILRKKSRKEKIPFIPFVMCGFLIMGVI